MGDPLQPGGGVLKRALRRLGLASALVVLLIPILLFAALETLRSDYGRERLRTELLAAADPLFAGELRVERIGGDFTTHLIVNGVQIFDREGRRAIAIETARADYVVLDLIERLHLERIAITGLEVEAFTTTAGVNLAELIVPGEPPPEPSEPVTLSIGSIALLGARIAWDGRTIADELDLSLGLGVDRGRLEASRLELALDGARLSSERASFDPGTASLEAALELGVPGALLSRWSGDPALAADLMVTVKASHRPLGAWLADAKGTIAGAPFSLTATASAQLARTEARLVMSRLDPNAVHRSAPRGRFDLVADARLGGGRVALDLDGRGTLTASSTELRLDRIAGTATLAGGRLAFYASLDSISDRARAEGSLLLEPLVLEDARVDLEIASVRPYLPPELSLDGALSVRASASGPIESMRAGAEVELRDLELPDLSVRRLRAAVDLLDRRGTIALTAEGGAPISFAQARGDFTLAEGGGKLALSRAELMLRGARISAAPSVVFYAPGALSIDARISSPAGDLRAKVSLDPAALLTAPGRIELAAPKLSLAGIGSLLPEPVALAGHAQLSIAGAVGPHRDLGVELLLDGARYRGTVPIGGRVALRLRRDLTGELALEAPGVARARAELVSSVPLDPLGWRPHHLERAALEVASSDLAAVMEQVILLGGPAIELAGTASLSADVARARDRFAVTARLQATAAAPVATNTTFDASGSVPRDPGRWKSIDHRALERAELIVTPADVRLLAGLAGIEPPLSGTVSMNARAGAALDVVSAAIAIDDVRLSQLDEPLHADLRVEGTSHRISAVGSVRAGVRPALALQAALAAGAKDLLEGTVIAGRAPIEATLRLLGFPLRSLAELVDREDAFAGELTGTASLVGTIDAPRAQLELEAAGARFGAMDFDRFRIGGSYVPELVTAEVDLKQAVGGWMALRSKVGLEDRRIEMGVRASRFSIDFLSHVLPERLGLGAGGRLDADLTMAGVPEELSASGWLALSDGTLLPPQPLGTLESLAIDLKARERSITIEASAKSGAGDLSARIRSERTQVGLEVDGTFETRALPLALGRTPVSVDLSALISGIVTSEEMRLAAAITDGSVEVAENEAREVHAVEPLDDVVFVDARGTKQPKRPQPSAPPESARTEIAVRTSKPLPVKSRDLNATVEVDLRVVGGRAIGTVSLGEGSIQIGGRPWRIERARIDLDGSAPPRPVLDVLLVHELEAVVVSIFVSGTPDHPEVRFESSPATYDQAALLAIVLGADPDGGGGAALEGEAAGVAASYLVGAIRSGLGQDLWLDTIGVDLDDPRAARLQVGKWITREIFLGYEHDFGATEEENQAEAVLRYRFLPGWMIESRFGDRAKGGVDLFWTKRF